MISLRFPVTALFDRFVGTGKLLNIELLFEILIGNVTFSAIAGSRIRYTIRVTTKHESSRG
jgi:hypothetical protein